VFHCFLEPEQGLRLAQNGMISRLPAFRPVAFPSRLKFPIGSALCVTGWQDLSVFVMELPEFWQSVALGGSLWVTEGLRSPTVRRSAFPADG
jgi:hypothetical protein